MSSGLPGSSTARSSAGYQNAVLKIRTPVVVTLAKRKLSLQSVMDLVPGSVLTFETHCDEPLLLEIGDQSIARGETVKIGDKFGLRIREILGEPRDA